MRVSVPSINDGLYVEPIDWDEFYGVRCALDSAGFLLLTINEAENLRERNRNRNAGVL
jgi:hypothetical protein